MIAPATMTAPAQFDNQQCPARPLCEGEQHTGGDRVHAAGNGEEPPIQFRTCYLVRLPQHPRRADAISTTATTKKRPANAAATRKMVTRTR